MRSDNRLSLRLRPNQAPAAIKLKSEPGAIQKAIELVERCYASHLFIGSKEGQYVGRVNVTIFGNLVACYAVPGPANKTLLYYDVNQRTRGLRKEVIAQITRHTSGLYDSIDFDNPRSERQLFRNLGGRESTGWQLHEAISSKHTKITAAHHVHFAFKEVVDMLGPNSQEIRLALSITKEATNAMLTGVALWASGLNDEELDMIDRSGIFRSATLADYKRRAKQLSVEAKSLQNLVDRDLRKFFELEVLVNRVDGLVNWAEEHDNRVNPNLANVDPKAVYDAAGRLFTRAVGVGKKARYMEWEDYWHSRWQWSAAGSIHSQYPEDEKYIFSDIYLKNKFISLLSMSETSHDDWLKREPELHAWASTKYEWSKLRAIYGTDLTSYIHAHFAFYNCEDILPAPFPVGKAANNENVKRRVAAILKGNTQYCVDFEDFNSQHSIGAMQAVIDAYRDTYGHHLSATQLASIEWTRQSLERNIVHDNQGLKRQYRASGTLLSGWRLTTFMNSVLNYIYSEMLVPQTVQRNNSLHNGDDVLLGSTSISEVLNAEKNARKNGIRLQMSKCSYGAIAEFLRVDHKRGSKGQYLSRAVATLVHSRIESKPSSDMRDLIESLESRLDDCYSRGLSAGLVSRLRLRYYTRQCERLNMSVANCYTVKTSHRCVGGVSAHKWADVSHIITSSARRKGATQVGVLPGVVDYSRMVKAVLQLEKPLQPFISKIMKATYDAVIPKDRTVKVSVNKEKRRYEILRALFKVHAEETDIVNFGKAKMTGFLLDVLNRQEKSGPLLHLLKGAEDPLAILNIVT